MALCTRVLVSSLVDFRIFRLSAPPPPAPFPPSFARSWVSRLSPSSTHAQQNPLPSFLLGDFGITLFSLISFFFFFNARRSFQFIVFRAADALYPSSMLNVFVRSRVRLEKNKLVNEILFSLLLRSV